MTARRMARGDPSATGEGHPGRVKRVAPVLQRKPLTRLLCVWEEPAVVPMNLESCHL